MIFLFHYRVLNKVVQNVIRYNGIFWPHNFSSVPTVKYEKHVTCCMYDVRMHVNANGKFEAIPSTLLSQVFIYFSTFLVALLAHSLLSAHALYHTIRYTAYHLRIYLVWWYDIPTSYPIFSILEELQYTVDIQYLSFKAIWTQRLAQQSRIDTGQIPDTDVISIVLSTWPRLPISFSKWKKIWMNNWI